MALTALRLALLLAGLVLATPVLGIALSWLALDAAALDVLRHAWQTVLPGYLRESLLLAAGVALGTALVGVGAAVVVVLHEFPGRRSLEWALLLPMAMPAYVLAYACTDALQFSGPLQTALREALDRRTALWPDVRSLPGAIAMFVLTLYPYVYLLTAAALRERGATLLEAARLLGAGRWHRLWRVALPLARPAVAAGVALALMETLADVGVGSYFGLTTFTTGIFRAWLSMNEPWAAAQLASLLLMLVAVLLALESRARHRLRFVTARPGAAAGPELRRTRLRGGRAVLAFGLCALPLLLGFVLPAAWLVAMLAREAAVHDIGLPWARFLSWTVASFGLAGVTAALATLLALALGFAVRQGGPALPAAGLRLVARALSLGYAVPGAVLAVGILLPLGWAQARWPEAGWGTLLTSSAAGLLLAYLVRFSAVALQSVEAGYARLPPSLDDTARLLGSGPGRRWWSLHRPLLQRSALVAGLLVFVDTLKELPATLILRPFGSDTLAVIAYQLARDERLAEAALPALAIVAVGLLPVILLARALREPVVRVDRVAPPTGIEPVSSA